MSVDLPRAWEITFSVQPLNHHPRCSYRLLKMLCDCSILLEHPEYLDDEPHSVVPPQYYEWCVHHYRLDNVGGWLDKFATKKLATQHAMNIMDAGVFEEYHPEEVCLGDAMVCWQDRVNMEGVCVYKVKVDRKVDGS